MQTQQSKHHVLLWDDNPSDVDLLGFDAVVAPVLTALNAPNLDPLTIGIHGPWGSGKSTVLRLLENQIACDQSHVVIRTRPWEFDNQADVKGTLIAEVLEALELRFGGEASVTDKVGNLLKRISWSRVGFALGKGAITMQWDPKELIEAFTPDRRDAPHSMAGFRDAFGELLDDLPQVTRVVVLVDDLDRCLPDAVMSTLEAIKLFLSVKKMIFVVAADQDMVRDAIAASLDASSRSERFAVRYLEKIVQLPVSLPRLAQYEAEAYITLLLVHAECGQGDAFDRLVAHCSERRRRNVLPLVGEMSALDWRPDDELLLLAGQFAHGLGADRVSNPRQIKRFLNAFGVRREVAGARGLEVAPAVIAKLLLLEDQYREDFETLAATPENGRGDLLRRWEEWARSDAGDVPEGIKERTREWAAAEPLLADEELAPYITLAAALASVDFAAGMSDELLALIGRLLGPSEADRSLAVESVTTRTTSEQRLIAQGLIQRARRTEDVTLIVESAIKLAQANPELADPIADGIAEQCWPRLDPGAAVDLAACGVEGLVNLARKLSEDTGIEPDVRKAAAEALRGPV